MLTSAQVPLAESALLVIDVQESFRALPRWQRRNNPDFERNVSALIDAHRRAGLPVLFMIHTDDDETFRRESPHHRLMDFLGRRDDEPLFDKTTRNGFTSTTLATELLARGVRRLAVTGIQMEQCCETTARLAADLGYAVDFVSDATLTFPIPHPDRPGEELGVEEIACRTEYALRGRFARIVTTAALVDEIAHAKARRAA